jgi:hypothetical protein
VTELAIPRRHIPRLPISGRLIPGLPARVGRPAVLAFAAGGPPPAPADIRGGLPVDMVERGPGLAIGGVEPVAGLAVGGVEPVAGLAVGGVEPVAGLAVSGLEPVPGLVDGGRRERFGAGLAAVAPFGDDRGADRRLAGAGHRLASYRQMT